MLYYSTNGKAPNADLHKAVVKGLAEDRGLYMPEHIKKLPKAFFDNIEKMTFQEISYTVASAFLVKMWMRIHYMILFMTHYPLIVP